MSDDPEAPLPFEILRGACEKMRGHMQLMYIVKISGKRADEGVVKMTDPDHREREAQRLVDRFNGHSPGKDAILERFFALQEEAEGDEGDEAKSSMRDQLIALALEHADLFHDRGGECYARVNVGDHDETYPVEAREFRRWLEGLYYISTYRGAGGQAITDALCTIAARARNHGDEREVYRRMASDGATGCYIDLCDGHGHVVHVMPGRWTVLQNPAIDFIRSSASLALPMPATGGDLERLKPYINVHDADAWALVKAYLVAALYYQGPYPILQFRAEHGAAKSTAARVLRLLIDPAKAPLRGAPKDSVDVAVAVLHNWLVAFDNLSYIPQSLSDDLCRVSTGMGLGKRQLFTDGEEFLVEGMRPILITSITECVTSEDMVDRLLPILLPPIEKKTRRSERKLWADFERERPALFGVLLDRLAGALRELPNVPDDNLPRMADFAQLAMAAEMGAGEPPLFLSAYESVREDADRVSIDNHILGPALKKMWARMTNPKETTLTNPWEGTMAELQEALSALATDLAKRHKSWPKSAHALAGSLQRLAPALRRKGVTLDFPEDHRREAGTGRRLLLMTYKESQESNEVSVCDKLAGADEPAKRVPEGTLSQTLSHPEGHDAMEFERGIDDLMEGVTL